MLLKDFILYITEYINKNPSRIDDLFKDIVHIKMNTSDEVLNNFFLDFIHFKVHSLLLNYSDMFKKLAFKKEYISYVIPSDSDLYRLYDSLLKEYPKSTVVKTTEKITPDIPDKPSFCVIYISYSNKPEFINTVNATKAIFNTDIFYLDTVCDMSKEGIPAFTKEVLQKYNKALLWSDRYYTLSSKVNIQNIHPIVSQESESVTGPIMVDLNLFNDILPNITPTADVAYQYIKENDLFSSFTKTNNIFTVNRKLCCRAAADMGRASVIYIPDDGLGFIKSSMKLLIKTRGVAHD